MRRSVEFFSYLGSRGGASGRGPIHSDHPGGGRPPAPGGAVLAQPAAAAGDRRRAAAWFAAFALFAGIVATTAGQPVQRTWGLSAVAGYGLAALIAGMQRSRCREAALVVAVTGALAAPLTWQVTVGDTMSKVGEGSLTVVTRAAVLLLRHGSPYLPASQISRFLDYNPYEPAMAAFGLPAAAGLHGAAGNPRLWMGITTAAALTAAFRLVRPGSVLRSTTFALASPVLALPLTTGLTDPPVLALLGLAFACSAASARRRSHLAAAVALGAACAIKATAWPAVPVVAALFAARYGGRAAAMLTVMAGSVALALSVATAWASVLTPAALFQNVALFPLGLTRYQTSADSPLPGHLLAATGPTGRWAAIGLLCAVGVAMAASLVVKPPRDSRAAAWRLAIGLILVFTLAPASRWGYFVYPAALLGFVHISRSERGPWAPVKHGISGSPGSRGNVGPVATPAELVTASRSLPGAAGTLASQSGRSAAEPSPDSGADTEH